MRILHINLKNVCTVIFAFIIVGGCSHSADDELVENLEQQAQKPVDQGGEPELAGEAIAEDREKIEEQGIQVEENPMQEPLPDSQASALLPNEKQRTEPIENSETLDQVISSFESEQSVSNQQPMITPPTNSIPDVQRDSQDLSGTTEASSYADQDSVSAPVDFNPDTMGRYTVRSGDFLGSISKKLFGTSKKWEFLADYNRIEDADVLEVGDVIMYPTDMVVNQDEPSTPVDGTVKVAKNDTLSQIAERVLGNSDLWRKIWDKNKDTIQDPNKIEIGQELVMPDNISAH